MRQPQTLVADAWVPEKALAAGFSNSPIGTHTGKTMMLAELRLLLAAVPGSVEFSAYQRAAVEENALAKSTAANRSQHAHVPQAALRTASRHSRVYGHA